MDLSRIRVVCFDAVDTLFRVRGSVGEVYARMAEPFGVRLAPAAIQRAFGDVLAQAPPPAFPGASPQQIPKLETQYWHNIVRAVFDRLGGIPRFEAYFQSVYEAFRRADTWELFADTRPALEHLRNTGRRIGVISNFDSRIYDVFDALNLRVYVDGFFISTQIGAAKPDRRLFQAALDYFACSGDQALFIGDSPREDVEGAARAGMVSVLLDRDGRHNAPSGALRITDLFQLLG